MNDSSNVMTSAPLEQQKQWWPAQQDSGPSSLSVAPMLAEVTDAKTGSPLQKANAARSAVSHNTSASIPARRRREAAIRDDCTTEDAGPAIGVPNVAQRAYDESKQWYGSPEDLLEQKRAGKPQSVSSGWCRVRTAEQDRERGRPHGHQRKTDQESQALSHGFLSAASQRSIAVI